MSGPERRVLDAFRRQFHQNRADLDAFDRAFRAEDFAGRTTDGIRDWCVRWWEERLQARATDHGERRLRGTQGRN